LTARSSAHARRGSFTVPVPSVSDASDAAAKPPALRRPNASATPACACKMTAPPRGWRCSTFTSSRDDVFSAPASPRACPRVFCAVALVSPLLLPRPRSQALRRTILPQLLRGLRRGTSASFGSCRHLLPCIFSSMGSRRSRKCCHPNARVKSGLPRARFQ
jgi:hypothetical protein